MQVTKGTWRMHKQWAPGSLSSSPAREPGNEASIFHNYTWQTFCHSISRPFLSMQGYMYNLCLTVVHDDNH